MSTRFAQLYKRNQYHRNATATAARLPPCRCNMHPFKKEFKRTGGQVWRARHGLPPIGAKENGARNSCWGYGVLYDAITRFVRSRGICTSTLDQPYPFTLRCCLVEVGRTIGTNS
eukprot:172087-Rhodomonas_salina.2